MTRYFIKAKVDQIVTKEVQMIVEADNPEKAQDRAREALQDYPEPIQTEGVSRIVTNKIKFWIPRDIEFTVVEEESDIA